MIASARTHVGRVRTNNEDAYVCRPEQGLLVVVDGMGGQEAGEVAAAIAVETLAAIPPEAGLASEAALSQGFREARRRILAEADRNPLVRSLGAVATAVRLEDDGRSLAVAHVGDTRAYLISKAGVRLLTRDHVQAGEGKTPVTRDLGRRDMEDPWVDTARVKVSAGDMILLCSDGLYGPVGDAALTTELLRLHREQPPPDQAVARLVAMALSAGGPDNITVVVAYVRRFQRRRFPWLRLALAGVVVGLLGLLIAVILLLGAQAFPGIVRGNRQILLPGLFEIPAGQLTTVQPDAHLSFQGLRATGGDWRISVEAGGQLTFDLCRINLDQLDVQLADNARLEFIDTDVSARSITVRGPETSKTVMINAGLRVTEGAGPVLAVPVEQSPPPPELAPIQGQVTDPVEETP